MHFWHVVTLFLGGTSAPVKYGFNGVMPALIRRIELSLCGTSENDFIARCPFDSINSRNIFLSWLTPYFSKVFSSQNTKHPQNYITCEIISQDFLITWNTSAFLTSRAKCEAPSLIHKLRHLDLDKGYTCLLLSHGIRCIRRKLVTPLIFRMTGMASDPVPGNGMRFGSLKKFLPEIFIQHRLSV